MITRCYVNIFKSLMNFSITLNNMNVIIGKNFTGKSSLAVTGEGSTDYGKRDSQIKGTRIM